MIDGRGRNGRWWYLLHPRGRDPDKTAVGMDVDPRPFLMAITFAASLSLITPWGCQTNTLIYGPGRYTFQGFTKVGAPLNIFFWVLSSIFIPLFWKF